MGKKLAAQWLTVLFWLNILGVLLSVLTQEKMMEWVGALYGLGMVLNVVYLIGEMAVLLKLSPENGYYRRAFIFNVSAATIGVAMYFLPAVEMLAILVLLLAIANLVLLLLGAYFEIRGHARILQGIDDVLAQKWRRLWRWMIGLLAALIPGMALVRFMPLLGIIIFVGLTVGFLVIGVQRLIYLYRMAQIFKRLGAEAPKEAGQGGV